MHCLTVYGHVKPKAEERYNFECWSWEPNRIMKFDTQSLATSSRSGPSVINIHRCWPVLSWLEQLHRDFIVSTDGLWSKNLLRVRFVVETQSIFGWHRLSKMFVLVFVCGWMSGSLLQQQWPLPVVSLANEEQEGITIKTISVLKHKYWIAFSPGNGVSERCRIAPLATSDGAPCFSAHFKHSLDQKKKIQKDFLKLDS